MDKINSFYVFIDSLPLTDEEKQRLKNMLTTAYLMGAESKTNLKDPFHIKGDT